MCVQLEEVAIEMFNNIVRLDNIPINMFVLTEPKLLVEYIGGWKMKLKDMAYMRMSKKGNLSKNLITSRISKGLCKRSSA